MLPFKNRFHGHGSLRYVYKNGRAIRSHLMTIRFIKNKHRRDSRVAVIVGKKVLKSAVLRNRARRRVYEALRFRTKLLSGAFDIAVIITSGEIITVPFTEITKSIDESFKQFGLYKTE